MKSFVKVVATTATFFLVALGSPSHALEQPGKELSGNLEVAAFGPRSVLENHVTEVGFGPYAGAFTPANGVDWYNWHNDGGGSIGFLAPGDSITLASCSTSTGLLGTCWHLFDDTQIGWGYAYNEVSGVRDTLGIYRAIYTSDSPEYYPSGIVTDIDAAELDGWEACWVDDWGYNASTSLFLSDLATQCDGDFIAMVVGAEVRDIGAEEPTETLASTGTPDLVLQSSLIVFTFVALGIAIRRRAV